MPVNYAELRRRLETSESDLREQIDAMRSEVREEGVGYSNHMADAGTEVFEQQLDLSLSQQLQRSHLEVQKAIAKFDDGTYGLCEYCGARIELARLEVVPEARHCLDCQTRIESRR